MRDKVKVKNTDVLYTMVYHDIVMTASTYFIVMDCADDTEKKRVRYVIDKWEAESKGKVSEVKAIVAKANLDNIGDFLDELYSRMSAGRIETYRAEIEKIEPKKRIESLKVTFKNDIKSVERLISFIFSKKNSTLREHRYLHDNFSEMEYVVYVRRGKGGVSVKVVLREEKERAGETTADIRLEGIEDAPKALKEDLMCDFSYFDVELESFTSP